MKKYNVTVNGNTYEVEVDEIGGAPSVAPASAAAAPAPATAAAPAPAAPASAPTAVAASAPSSGSERVDAPMPGTILDVLKKPGDTVAENEVVLILEAMKMENEIVSPKTGTIDVIGVSKGVAAEAGQFLFSVN